MVTFAEIPDEICLSFNISNCQNRCVGCHSPELRQDIGEVLTVESLAQAIKANDGITCVLFLGEGNDTHELLALSNAAHDLGLKSALYSGREYDEIEPEIWETFDYVKVGPYVKLFGPLNAPTTNQRLYKLTHVASNNSFPENVQKVDITEKFWREA